MKTIPLRYVADVRSSSVDKLSNDGEQAVRLCNYTDVYSNDCVNPSLNLMQATATSEEVARFRLEVGDSVITKDSEDPQDIGISAFVDATAEDLVCGYHLAVIRPDSVIYPRYFNWSLRSRQVLGHWSSQASGMTRYGLGLGGIKSAPIHVPALEEQRRIADFLDDRVARIDRIIAARCEQMASLSATRRAAADYALEEVDRHHRVRLGYFIISIEQGWSPQCDSIPALPEEWGVLKVSSVRPGRFYPEENKRLPNELEPLCDYAVRPRDLLVTRANTPVLVGAFAVVPDGVRSRLLMSDKIMRVRLSSEFDPDFVALVAQTMVVRERLSSAGTGTSQSMVNIRGEDIRDLRAPKLSKNRQCEVVARHTRAIAAIDRHGNTLKDVINLLTEYKSSLITAAVTGELDVTTAGSGIPG